MSRVTAVLLFVVLLPRPIIGQSASDLLRPVERKFRIAVQWQKIDLPLRTRSGAITGRAVSQAKAGAYAKLFVPEFNIYPTAFISKSKLRRVVFCRDLAFDGQKRTAVPHFSGNTLYLDAVRGSRTPDYQRAVIHHEFFHMIDWRDDGRLYRDAGWSALNDAGFKYGRGGRTVQNDPTQSMFITEPKGFLTRYSLSGVEEDKAELFSHLVVNPSVVKKRSAQDRILAAKVKRMHQLLSKFSPAMNADFWKRVSEREKRRRREKSGNASTRPDGGRVKKEKKQP